MLLVPMPEVTILTAAKSYTLSHDDAIRLLEHIRRDGSAHRGKAATPIVDAVTSEGAQEAKWSAEGKRGILAAIAGWLRVEGASDIPDVVIDLRFELMRDLRIESFDVD